MIYVLKALFLFMQVLKNFEMINNWMKYIGLEDQALELPLSWESRYIPTKTTFDVCISTCTLRVDSLTCPKS